MIRAACWVGYPNEPQPPELHDFIEQRRPNETKPREIRDFIEQRRPNEANAPELHDFIEQHRPNEVKLRELHDFVEQFVFEEHYNWIDLPKQPSMPLRGTTKDENLLRERLLRSYFQGSYDSIT